MIRLIPRLLALTALALPSVSLLAGATVAPGLQTVTLKDGRVLTGIYDDSAGTITISGPAKAVIRVSKDDVVNVEQAKAEALVAPSEPVRKREVDPLAAIDQQIAEKTKEKEEAESHNKELTAKAREETDAAARQDIGPDRQRLANERAQRFTQAATKYQATAARLGTEISELQTKRTELSKKQDDLAKVRTTVEEGSKKAAEGVTALVDGVKKEVDKANANATPFERQQRLEAENKELKARIAQLDAQIKEHDAALAQLKTQLDRDMATIKTLDLTELTWKDLPNEGEAAKAQRLADFKAYNLAMASLRNAKTDYQAGTRPNYEAAFALLHQDAQRKLYQQKTGKPLVFPDDADSKK